jgi:hypothetical protein
VHGYNAFGFSSKTFQQVVGEMLYGYLRTKCTLMHTHPYGSGNFEITRSRDGPEI